MQSESSRFVPYDGPGSVPKGGRTAPDDASEAGLPLTSVYPLKNLGLVLVPVFLVVALGFAQAHFRLSANTFFVCFGGGAVIAAVGVYRCVRDIIAVKRFSAWAVPGVAGTFGALALGLFTSPASALLALITSSPFSRGRQFRIRGKPTFAPIIEDEAGWLAAGHEGPGASPEVAEAWRVNGLTEHASVAAFGRLAMDLVALGAPAALIEGAHADALDEHRHTRLCFGLARDLDGRTLSPGPFPQVSSLRADRRPRPQRLVDLAVESLVDGALNEGVSARVVAGLAKVVTDSRVQDVLQIIARDEARHAAHGFDVMRWCVEEGGEPVIRALHQALRHIPTSPGPLPYDIPGCEVWGLPDNQRLQAEYRRVVGRLVERTQRLLDEARPVAA